MHIAEVVIDVELHLLLASVHQEIKSRCHGHFFEFAEQACATAQFAAKATLILLSFFGTIEQVVVKDPTDRLFIGSLLNDRLAILVELAPPIVAINPILHRRIFEEEAIEEFVPRETALFLAGGVLNVVV